MLEKVLVTGAGGWLGSELTKQLLERGYKVVAFNKTITKALEELEKKYGNLLQIQIGDILNNDSIEKAIKEVTEVYHLAAKVHSIPTNRKEEEIFYKVNAEATEMIFKYCVKYNVRRVIFFSSVSVFERTQKIISQESNKNPDTIYGKSKLKAEKIGEKYYEHFNLPITIIEPVTVYGEGDVGNFRKLEKMIESRIVVSFGKQENRKTVIYYKDLIDMVIEIKNDPSTIGKSIICGTETITVKEIYNILIEKQNKKIINIKIPQNLINILTKFCNFSTLKKIGRKIVALTENSEFDLLQCEKYIKKNTVTFKNFELNRNEE